MPSTAELKHADRSVAIAQPELARSAHHHWSAWVGFAFYVVFASTIVLRSPKVGILFLPTFLYELMIAVTFLTRQPVRQKLGGWRARLAAYSGTFLLPVFVAVAGHWRPGWLRLSSAPPLHVMGVVLWVFGTAFAFVTLYYMRYSFSLMPQARQLVTNGPFRVARHPIYASYLLQYVGIWLTHPTAPLALAVLLWFGIALVRVHYEEQVLAAAFLEYSEYRQVVGGFGLVFRRPMQRARHVAAVAHPGYSYRNTKAS